VWAEEEKKKGTNLKVFVAVDELGPKLIHQFRMRPSGILGLLRRLGGVGVHEGDLANEVGRREVGVVRQDVFHKLGLADLEQQRAT